MAASSGALALEVVRATNALDLVMTDYLMPGMNGAELADQIRRIRPNLPVLIVTGYAETLGHEKRAFPFLPMTEVGEWLNRRGEMSNTALIRAFRAWVRQQAGGWRTP